MDFGEFADSWMQSESFISSFEFSESMPAPGLAVGSYREEPKVRNNLGFALIPQAGSCHRLGRIRSANVTRAQIGQ
jgi:hypothetical protein